VCSLFPTAFSTSYLQVQCYPPFQQLHAVFGEKVACAAVSPHLNILSDIKVQCYPPLQQLHLVLGEKVACAAVSPHLNILSDIQVQCYPPLKQLHSDFDISVTRGICHIN